MCDIERKNNNFNSHNKTHLLTTLAGIVRLVNQTFFHFSPVGKFGQDFSVESGPPAEGGMRIPRSSRKPVDPCRRITLSEEDCIPLKKIRSVQFSFLKITKRIQFLRNSFSTDTFVVLFNLVIVIQIEIIYLHRFIL